MRSSPGNYGPLVGLGMAAIVAAGVRWSSLIAAYAG